MDDFSLFDPLTGNGNDLPEVPGNYLVTIRDIRSLPTLGFNVNTQLYKGQNLIYTGVAGTSIRGRIWRNHLGGNAGLSTLRLTLGCLHGYKLIPRDKNDPNNGHVRFNSDDEKKLREWMKENLVFHYLPNESPKVLESDLMERLNPPLNISGNENAVNRDFRSRLTFLRSQKPWLKSESKISMKKFDYKCVDCTVPSGLEAMMTEIRRLGMEGWELVSVCPTMSSQYGVEQLTAFLKKEV